MNSPKMSLLACSSEMTSCEDNDYQKEDKWKMFLTNKSVSNDDSDEVPDYVFQESQCYEDFSATMKSFISKITDVESKDDEIAINATDYERISDTSDDEKDWSHFMDNVDNNDDSFESILKPRRDGDEELLSGLFSEENDTIQPDRLRNRERKVEDKPATSRSLSRSGSDSLPSIDSGYSPDSTDVSRSSANDDKDLISYKLQTPLDFVISSECEMPSDDDEVEYMAYVLT